MIRLLPSSVKIVMAVVVMAGAATPSFAISPRNPYRSFNLSGINYGSMRWEQQHRQSQPSTSRRSRSRRARTSNAMSSSRVIVGSTAGGVSTGTVVAEGRQPTVTSSP